MKKSKDDKYSTIHYHSYLQLDKILGAQRMRSEELDGEAAHEEMLFIIVHQAYELWFKQITYELESVIDMFKKDDVDERSLGVAVGRLNRVIEILKLLVQQIRVIETMTPLDFLDFRNYLFPASGFQSFQFRKVENLLGLADKNRITYHGQPYTCVFQQQQQDVLRDLESNSSLFEAVEAWLERTPFVNFKGFDFLQSYGEAVAKMLSKEEAAIEASTLTDQEKEIRLNMLKGTENYFQFVLDEKVHQKQREEGRIRMSYSATVAALFINLYREEPILHNPFRLLVALVEIDELLTSWRSRHAQMVLRMLGKKMGTGGSSGHDYLNTTAEKHAIFQDFHNISTLLIPRSELPELPDFLKKELSFSFSYLHPRK